jgi:diguanylate cyclase (GGDEF)-like protein
LPAEQRQAEDRRGPGRIHADMPAPFQREPDRLIAELDFYLPRHSIGIAVSLAVAFAIAAGVVGALPSLSTGMAGLSALALFAAGPLFAAAERKGQGSRLVGLGLLVVAVIVPMALAGHALAAAIEEGMPWQWAVATLVCLNAAAAVHFGMRIVSMFCANLASWTGFALVAPEPQTFMSLMGAAITLALIARFEWRALERRRIAREARERVAARAEDILRSFEESGEGWFWETDRRGLITYISPKAARVLGRSSADICGCPFTDIMDPGIAPGDGERTLAFHLSARSAFQDIEILAASATEDRWWALTGRPVYDSFHNFCGFRGHGTDLTEQRRSEQQVSRLAHYDSLTGLANRVQMGRALEQILAAPSARERASAVLMLDLDRFKQVNDTLGHPAGDALLKQVAQRLERTIGAAGRCGRLGGDEFQVIIPGQQNRAMLGRTAREIIAALSQPYVIGGHTVVIGASVGIALAPEHGTTSDALVRNVDLALYAAKDAGRGCYRFYEADLHAAAEERAELEQDLRDAIAREEMALHYQPVIHAASERIVGFEALLRWNHPRRGFLPPSKFIPIAEDAGLIDRIGQWVLRSACADMARWPASIRCSVNVSALQFANPDLPAIVANALAHSGVAPARLELEITESVFLSDNDGTDAMFKALKRVGVRLALDDFGTGYSSLAYLRKAPFDRIKIDRNFVQGASERGSRNGAIIASITGLAEALHMDTTAEGVETLDELELVRLLGCSHVQGHVYHRPMNAAAATALVAGDLMAVADGPQSVRAPRQVLLRRVVVVHDGNWLTVTLRNISQGGAMIEGLENVPIGSTIRITFSAEQSVTGAVRWTCENRVGVEFHNPLGRRSDGSFVLLRPGSGESGNVGRRDVCQQGRG